MRETMYLSGPMGGRPLAEVEEEFNHYAAKYRSKGFTVVNPMDMDGGDHGTVDADGIMRPDEAEWRRFIHRDISYILDPANKISHIGMLPHWQNSRGANLELFVAESVNIIALDAQTGDPL